MGIEQFKRDLVDSITAAKQNGVNDRDIVMIMFKLTKTILSSIQQEELVTKDMVRKQKTLEDLYNWRR